MAVRRVGDWQAARRKLTSNLGGRLAMALQQATIKNALVLVREIKLGIRAQAPGDKPFVPLAESTIEAKGSSKALIDTGFLVNSITQRIMADKAFVGILRTASNKDGVRLENIGAIMEFGATIRQPNGVVVLIPARPFLHPSLEKYRDEIVENYRKAVSTSL